MKFNDYFGNLPPSYVFEGLAVKKNLARKKWGDDLIDLGIGDVRLPLFGCIADEMKKAADELTATDGFRGYPPASGYDFLKDAISSDYAKLGITVDRSEIFVNDGAKGELFALNSLMSGGSKIVFPTPCYPAAPEAAILHGNEPVFTRSDENGTPIPPFGKKCDAVYLCSPSNPSGKAMNKTELALWVEYALSVGATIFFDGAYSDYIPDGGIKSIYLVPGAKKCAAEIRSFSKGYGFTGIRLGYVVVPREQKELNDLRKRLSGCLDNGVSYVTQRGGAACFSKEGQAEMKKRVDYYKANAAVLKRALKKLGLKSADGNDSPYVYAECPGRFTDEAFCALLSDKAGVIATPGRGFYEQNGEFFRLSAFAPKKEILAASDRIRGLNLTK